MKTRKFLATFALLAAVMMAATFTACSNEDNPVKPSLDRTEVDTVIWDSTNVIGMKAYRNEVYEKAGIKVKCADCDISWEDYGIEDEPVGLCFFVYQHGGFTFTNTLGKKFTKIELTLTVFDQWDIAAQDDKLGPGWPIGIDGAVKISQTHKVTWTGKAEKVDLLVDDQDNAYAPVSRIVFYLTD